MQRLTQQLTFEANASSYVGSLRIVEGTKMVEVSPFSDIDAIVLRGNGFESQVSVGCPLVVPNSGDAEVFAAFRPYGGPGGTKGANPEYPQGSPILEFYLYDCVMPAFNRRRPPKRHRRLPNPSVSTTLINRFEVPVHGRNRGSIWITNQDASIAMTWQARARMYLTNGAWDAMEYTLQGNTNLAADTTTAYHFDGIEAESIALYLQSASGTPSARFHALVFDD